MKEFDEKRFQLWKDLRDKIDKQIANKEGKKISHHITRITGRALPREYVVFVDGTEKAYNSEQEFELSKAQLYRETGKNLEF